MQLNVIKIGGNVIDNPKKLSTFLDDFSNLIGFKILVHGGGKIATKVAEKLGIETQMVEGRRVTDAAMVDVVTMVYGGLVNKQIVAKLQSKSCNAIGLTGADGKSVLAERRPVGPINYGFVGDIKSVNYNFIKSILDQHVTPVFAPLTFDWNGDILNTNADTIASALAVSLSAIYDVNLVYCFEKKGVLFDAGNENSVISSLNKQTYKEYKEQGIINEGMIPKLDNAFMALQNGVKQVIICHADDFKEGVEKGTVGTIIKL